MLRHHMGIRFGVSSGASLQSVEVGRNTYVPALTKTHRLEACAA
jgi:hypothetical protein